MRNQFFYTRKVEDKEFRDSFNIDMVIRTVSIESGETIVLLDDLHELTKEVPEINKYCEKCMYLYTGKQFI